MMKVIIAGSRGINDYKHVEEAMFKSNAYKIVTEVVSGGARGVDTLAIEWAKRNNIPYKVMKADWNNLDVPGAEVVIQENDDSDSLNYRYYNRRAGLQRNEDMGKYGDVLVAVTTGTPGTAHMINFMKGLNKKVYVHKVIEKAKPKRKDDIPI